MPYGNVKATIPISGRTNAQTLGTIAMRGAAAAGLKGTPSVKSPAQERAARDADTAFAKAFGLVPDNYQAPRGMRAKNPKGRGKTVVAQGDS